jgi:hypothetical protein
MSKILKAVDIETALAKAKTEGSMASLFAQIIESVKLQEMSDAADAEKYKIQQAELNSYKGVEAEAAKQIKALSAELTEATATIAELSERLTLREENPDAGILVRHGGKNYAILGNNFITESGELTAKSLSENKEEIARLVAIGSGILQEITKS